MNAKSFRLGSLSHAFAIASFVFSTAFWSVRSHADDAIRQSWQDFAKDPQNVASLRKAVAAMKANDSAPVNSPAYRMSWSYWANMHGYFGTQSKFGTVASNINKSKQAGYSTNDLKAFDGLKDLTPPDSTSKDVWANCAHGLDKADNVDWFFPWHRLFLYYFEKQLQKASGNPNLHLPYWDYTNPNQLKIPAEFQQPTYTDSSGKTQPNPLYEVRRASGWQTGQSSLDGNQTNIDSALSGKYSYFNYQNEIEGGVHGTVHCSVSVGCPVPDMGAVGYSANDPIFWVHHANIDRIWSCWSNMSGNSNPKDTYFLNKTFTFIDTNGQEVQSKVGDLFNGSLINYKYEQETDCSRVAPIKITGIPPVATGAMAHPFSLDMAKQLLTIPQILNKKVQPVMLRGPKTSVRVDFVPAKVANVDQPSNLLSFTELPSTTYLELKNITFKAHPGTMFNVYLQSIDDPNKKVQVGTLSFFDGSMMGLMDHNMGDHAMPVPSRELNVTEALRVLKQSDIKGVTVSFESTTGRVGSGEPINPSVNPKAELSIGSIEFRMELK